MAKKKEISPPVIKKERKFQVIIQEQSREYLSQKEAIDWAKKCLDAGIFFMNLQEIKNQ
jgi:hypothetical protein